MCRVQRSKHATRAIGCWQRASRNTYNFMKVGSLMARFYCVPTDMIFAIFTNEHQNFYRTDITTSDTVAVSRRHAGSVSPTVPRDAVRFRMETAAVRIALRFRYVVRVFIVRITLRLLRWNRPRSWAWEQDCRTARRLYSAARSERSVTQR